MLNFITQGVWTAERLEEAGYVVEVEEKVCALCGQAKDTLQHRLYECNHPEVRALRKEHLSWKYLSWLTGDKGNKREREGRRLAQAGLTRDPSYGQPQPAVEGSDFAGDPQAAAQAKHLFSDGIAFHYFHPKLDRAGWALGAIDEESGALIGVVYGPVEHPMAQTSPVAEMVALGSGTLSLIPDRSVANLQALYIGADNLTVVDLINKPPRPLELRRLANAGLAREIITSKSFSMIHSSYHIRSHQLDKNPDLVNNLPWKDLFHIRGNDMADEWADRGREMHEPLNKELLKLDHKVSRPQSNYCVLLPRPCRCGHL